MNLDGLLQMFVANGCTKLYAKTLAENDNSKNQVYFAGSVEPLNIFPSEKIFGENIESGPSFKARLNFSWLLESGQLAPAPHAQLILYAQYPEVRFSGFLLGCKASPGNLMADRKRAESFSMEMKRQLVGRVLFMGVSRDRRIIGYVASGTSEVAAEFNSRKFHTIFEVLCEIPLPQTIDDATARANLLTELKRINLLGWIDSKQLGANGELKKCEAPHCGGLTLEAELGIAKNAKSEPDFQGWEVKQYAVDDFERIESSKPITLMTPEPTGGFYKDHDVPAFVRKFGYPDKSGKVDRLNFGGRHFVGQACDATKLTLHLIGYNEKTGTITDANGYLALVSCTDEIAAKWSFSKILEHWSEKHAKAVYVPSNCRLGPIRQYWYGHKVRLAEKTDALRLLKALASGAVYYDPGIKLENASSAKPKKKNRSQFRVASKNIGSLYETVETVRL